MNRINGKLRSERGASITFALLLFLVCAVVSSIVIVAASTASGRMSNLPEIDQRYYAVSSAVELLGTTLNNQTVTVEKSQTITTETTYNTDGTVSGTPPVPAKSDPTTRFSLQGRGITPPDSSYSLLTGFAEELTNDVLVDADNNPNTETNMTQPYRDQHTLSVTEKSGTALADKGIDPSAILSVNIYHVLEPDGTLTFYVSKDATGGAYTMRMIFAAEKTENTVSHVDHGAPVMQANGGYIITDVENKTVTITYKWTLTRVEKSTVPSAAPPESGLPESGG